MYPRLFIHEMFFDNTEARRRRREGVRGEDAVPFTSLPHEAKPTNTDYEL